ncbi:T-complex protein 1, zeta subunit, partial [Kipferlia bialata]
PECLGKAGHVWITTLGEEKFTFVDEVADPTSCTILIRGPNKHTIKQIQDAVRDGLRAVLNLMEIGKVVPGAGAFEAAAAEDLEVFKRTVKGKAKLGVQVFADALNAVPKTLAQNAGHDPQDALVTIQDAIMEGQKAGVDIVTGGAIDALEAGIFDNYNVKHQLMSSSAIIAAQILLVDEILMAGRQLRVDDMAQ